MCRKVCQMYVDSETFVWSPFSTGDKLLTLTDARRDPPPKPPISLLKFALWTWRKSVGALINSLFTRLKSEGPLIVRLGLLRKGTAPSAGFLRFILVVITLSVVSNKTEERDLRCARLAAELRKYCFAFFPLKSLTFGSASVDISYIPQCIK